MTETKELRRRAAIGKTVRRNWAEMGEEERAERSVRLKAKKKEWWASLSEEDKARVARQTADGRRGSPRWLQAHKDAAARTYRRNGWAEDEIAHILTLGPVERQVARMRHRLYGVGPLAFRRMIDAQNGCCGICRKPMKGKIHVDHDHATGVVRGLLCPACNLAIGPIEAGGQEWLEQALIWIDRPWAKSGPEAD